MPLRLTRKHDGAVITFVRDDSTVTTARNRDHGFFATHDLMHYAVESVLRYDRAFLGLLAAGHDTDEWEDARSTLRLSPPEQASHAEAIVGMLHLKWSTEGAAALRNADPAELNAHLETHLGATPCVPPPALTAAQIRAIADRYLDLINRWSLTPVGETLELPWPSTTPEPG